MATTAARGAGPNGAGGLDEPIVDCRRLTKRFGGFVACDEVSLAIRRGEFFALLGPSGCGKTTLLRMIGGFELPSSGTVRVDGEEVTDTPPHRRPVNMVFQQYALFPHLTVAENVGFGLRYQRVPRAEWRARIDEALALVRLEGLEARSPHQLSGGQKQRVALARALVLKPKVLLLDEPLSALDQKLRKEVQIELKALQRRLGITFVFVTHDQEEALTMSDRIAVMNRGRVEQCQPAARVFEYPATEFVAQFMGADNFFTATVRELASGLLSLSLPPGREFKVPAAGAGGAPGSEVRFVVRPEKLDLRSRDLSASGIPSVEVTIEDRVYQGVSTVWVVRDGRGARYLIYEQNERPILERAKFEVGGRAFMCWSPKHTVLLAPEGGAGGAAEARPS
jgi:spermidine/putrescine transport system ATP-binding protein